MGLLGYLTTNPLLFFIIAPIIIIAITIHEFAHAWAADHLGDPTPRYQGRVTLNPLAHLDPLGTFLLFLIGFGWGRPVQFDPHNLKDPVKEAALIALAGPLTNFAFALLLALGVPLLSASFGSIVEWNLILYMGVFYNIMLAVFNLVPVYPLDGSKILLALLPRQMALEYDMLMNRHGMFILIALLLPLFNGSSAVSYLIFPVISFISNLFLGLASIL